MSGDLVAFLAARLDEDEAAAKEAAARPGPDWTNIGGFTGTDETEPVGAVMSGDGEATVVYEEGYPTVDEAAHIARHDPARVLREVAAKRAILAEHPVQAELLAWSLRQEHVKAGGAPPISWCDRCKIPIPDAREDEDQYEQVDWPCPTQRQLAAVYSGHPDYRQEWAP